MKGIGIPLLCSLLKEEWRQTAAIVIVPCGSLSAQMCVREALK
jgi:hypothetical protein